MKEIRTFDAQMAQLKAEFHPMILRNLKAAKRLDLITGYATSVVNEYDRKYGVRGYQVDKLSNGEISISKTFRTYGPDKDKVFYQNVTEESAIMTNAYNKYVIEGGQTPEINWRTKIRPYVSQEYLEKVAQLEKKVLAYKDPWDMCVVATIIPCSNVRKLEDAVIKQRNPLAVLEFASSVYGADLYKLRDAISTMEDTEKLVCGKKVDYLELFNDRFNLYGDSNADSHQPE